MMSALSKEIKTTAHGDARYVQCGLNHSGNRWLAEHIRDSWRPRIRCPRGARARHT